MTRLLDVVELIRKRLNRSLKVSAIVATMYDPRTNLSREVLAAAERLRDAVDQRRGRLRHVLQRIGDERHGCPDPFEMRHAVIDADQGNRQDNGKDYAKSGGGALYEQLLDGGILQ